MRTPRFWYNTKHSILPLLLTPLSWIYGLVYKNLQHHAKPWQAPIPVICVGNITAGGQGKTPMAISICKALKLNNKTVHFISRGYGGSLRGPFLVDPNVNTSSEVGDEPLLLSEIAPTWVSANRKTGIELAHKMGAEIIVMDDGFQNLSVKKDFSIVVIDGETGFGNGRLLPAGPLREGIIEGLSRANAVVIIGEDCLDLEITLSDTYSCPSQKPIDIYTAQLIPTSNSLSLLNEKVYAFTGIGRPEKFFNTLNEVGCDITGKQNFSDHHQFTEAEISELRKLAHATNSKLITTSKDYVRLTPSQQKNIKVLPVTLKWRDRSALDNILKSFI